MSTPILTRPSPGRSHRPPTRLLSAVATPRFLFTVWPWKGLAFTAGTVVVAGFLFSVAAPIYTPWLLAALLAFAETSTFFGGLGVFLILLGIIAVALFGPLVGIPLGIVERWRLGLVYDSVPDSGHRRVREPGLGAWVRTRYTEAATWRAVAYAGLTILTSFIIVIVLMTLVILAAVFAAGPVLVDEPGGVIDIGIVTIDNATQALPYTLLAPALLVAALYASALFSGLQAAMARALLTGPPAGELRAELDEVTGSRARLVNAFEYERRRIERDLHDGAQQRLVALNMDLGMARLELQEDSEADRRVVSAQAKATDLIDELRELVRGIHPRVLTDRGLPAALGELADHCPVPVQVEADLARRLPDHVEGTAYFVVAEALTNVHKHTEANAVAVHAGMTHQGGGLENRALVVEVTDYGPGGADPEQGSGLTGMRDRVAVMGGTMELSSPQGGPTRIRVELPCEANQPEK